MLQISERGYLDAAQKLDCEIAAIKAFAAVESNGGGMLPNGEPKILFEGHIFHKLTNGEYDITYPRISYPKWTKAFYVGGMGEHFRLQVACKLNREAGLKSASWGAFQILGENYESAGFKTLQGFINAMYAGDEEHLKAFVCFIQNNGLVKALQKKNWKLLAKKYNGPAYFENKYDVKLEQAYKRFATH